LNRWKHRSGELVDLAIPEGIRGMNIRRILFVLVAGVLFYGSFSCFSQVEAGDSDYQYALIEAVKQKNLGNLSEAVKLYRLVIKEKPDCDAAHYELGGIFLMTNQVDLAIQSLERSYNFDPDNQWYTLAYLNALGVGEDFETVVDLLKEKIKNDPEQVEWEYQLAAAYMSQEKPKKALKTLEKIEKNRGFSEKVTLLKATIYESQGEYDLALIELEKVIVLFPEAIQFRIVAAELCISSGRTDDAAGYYLGILDVDSTNIYALTNLTDYYREKEDYGNSFKYLARSFEFTEIEARRKMTHLSVYMSEDKFINNYADELDSLISVLIRVHPEQLEAKLMAADFHIKTKSYDKAYWHLKAYLDLKTGTYPMYMQAILLANAGALNQELINITGLTLKYYPDSADVRFFRGLGYYELEAYESMIDNFDRVNIENYSTKEYESQTRMLYAEAFYRLDDFSRSDSLFESLIAEEPDNYMVMNNYSYYLAERGSKLDMAEKWSRHTIENNPENVTFLDTYAWVLYKMESYEEAEKYIIKAIDRGGENDPEVNEHAGDIQVALSSFEIAKAYYQKAIILGGDQIILEEKISSLNQAVNE
jgi:tetratricopeptide (TPR) repeat protein